MRAATVVAYKQPLEVGEVPDPQCGSLDAIVEVEAEGMCRSDWHTWNGEWGWLDKIYGIEDVWSPAPPFIPGHELAGTVVEVGDGVRNFKVGDRVTLPFNEGCGGCYACVKGDTQVCLMLGAGGFSHSGGYGRLTAIPRADLNLVHLPESVDMVTAATLGCRYSTAYRAIVKQGCVRPGEWVAVFGAGGLGLSGVQIATAMGAHVIAVDPSPKARQLAKAQGAVATLSPHDDVHREIAEVSSGGVHVSFGAVGESEMLANSLLSLRMRGRHVQSGLTRAVDAGSQKILIDLLVVRELQMTGAWGCPQSDFPELLSLVEAGRLKPRELVEAEIGLEEISGVFQAMNTWDNTGYTVITRY